MFLRVTWWISKQDRLVSMSRITFLAFLSSRCSETTQRFKVSPLWKGKISNSFSKNALFSEIHSQAHKSKKNTYYPPFPYPPWRNRWRTIQVLNDLASVGSWDTVILAGCREDSRGPTASEEKNRRDEKSSCFHLPACYQPLTPSGASNRDPQILQSSSPLAFFTGIYTPS